MAVKQIDFRVTNLDCEHDASRLRRSLQDVPGVELLQVSPAACRVRLELDEAQTSPADVELRLSAIGFPVARETEPIGPAPLWKNPKVLASAASGLLVLVGWSLSWLEIPAAVP